MANGSSRAMMKAGGSASRSALSRARRSSSDNMGILLHGIGWKVNLNHAAGGVVLQQPVLMRVQEQPLHVFGRQQEQSPVPVKRKCPAGCPMETQTEGDKGEAPQRGRRVAELFSSAPLKDAEIP